MYIALLNITTWFDLKEKPKVKHQSNCDYDYPTSNQPKITEFIIHVIKIGWPIINCHNMFIPYKYMSFSFHINLNFKYIIE